MTASITLLSEGGIEGPDSNAVWRITISDDGGTFTIDVTYFSSRLSAEWIEEAPSIMGRHILRLADFDAVTFTDCYATIGEVTKSISRFGYHEDIVLVAKSRGVYVAVVIPSILSDSGGGFTVSYIAQTTRNARARY